MEVQLGDRVVDITHPDRVLYPDDGVTKADLSRYYEKVADQMLPHVTGRPLTLERYPGGLAGPGFYQKGVPKSFPSWIRRIEVPKEGGTVVHAIADEPAALVYLANLSCLTLHVWPTREDRLDYPDQMVFDLDPASDDFSLVVDTARLLRDLLDSLGYMPFVKTSGSRGLHVIVPLDRTARFDEVRARSAELAEEAAARDPERITTEFRKAARQGRLFLDTLRNNYAQHTVAPYSPRARPGAPVSAPLEWDELADSSLTSQRWTIKNILRRLAQRPDPWRDMFNYAGALR